MHNRQRRNKNGRLRDIKRNYINSISNNSYNYNNISGSNNKFCIWRRWNNKSSNTC